MTEAKGKKTRASGGDTPAMRQYRRFKDLHPDCILLFRMGDFYEMFYEDARLAHKVLGVTLTQRTEGIPMAGVPYHAVEGYLRRMIQAGYRVAVCEQMEDPAQAKGVVRRDVTRVITPGTLTDEMLLEEGKENPLAAVMFHSDQHASVAWAELSTGSFSMATLGADELTDELARIAPRELLYVETADGAAPGRIKALAEATGSILTARPTWQYRQAEAVETLCRQFQVATLAGFDLQEDDPALGPASAIIHYLLETQRTTEAPVDPKAVASSTAPSPAGRIAHLQPPRKFSRRDYLVIDQVSLRSLEVEQTMRTGGAQGSLLGVLQHCVTAMGKRRLRQWLCYPLAKREAIESRQRVVGALVEDSRFLDELVGALDQVQDVERMIGRISVGRATPRDLVGLGTSAAQVRALVSLLAQRPAVAPYYEQAKAVAGPLGELAQTLSAACIDSPPAHLRDGGLIRDGYDQQLDDVRAIQRDSSAWLAQYQKDLITQTNIPSLKVGYNKVFGYYIEVTAAHRDKAPAQWSRKQTLKNAERFITPQLKEYEGKVLSADSRAVTREQAIFAELGELAQGHVEHLRRFAQIVADLDVLACFARRAVRHRYVRPQIVDEPVLDVVGGRHPVLDELLADQFVPNDVVLGSRVQSPESRVQSPESEVQSPKSEVQGPPPRLAAAPQGRSPTLALITGPNMAGKSTYVRQTALIVLLAHTGSFVPAQEATIGLCDRIFTRVGASDELHAGQSTFMVEMTETANICHHATERSLVILDEIGRGTSTLDGLALAWAIAEHLAQRRARCLFATHYHEITALADQFDNVINLNVTVREWQDQIVFLHRIVAGATDRSYGIHVAKISGLPGKIVDRANALLAQLEVSHNPQPLVARAKSSTPQPHQQLSLFTEYVSHPALEKLKETDLDSLSPLEAFDLLRNLRQQLDQPP